MSKSIKVLSIVLIMFSFIVSFYGVYATDINMNLPTVDQPSNITSLDNNQNIEQSVEDIVPSTEDVNVNTSSNTAEIQPSNVSSIVEEGLGLTSILSILLITVGVILILLAIAIIIRLK